MPLGVWGGDHLGLTISDTDARLEFDCAHGEIPRRLTVNTAGRASVEGIYVQERGGPERVGQEPERQAARYDAHLDGQTLTLTVTLTKPGTTVGSFTLTRGRAPVVKKCR